MHEAEIDFFSFWNVRGVGKTRQERIYRCLMFFSISTGLFYDFGTAALVSQIIGVLASGAWAFGTGIVLFYILKKTIGLRVDARVETEGLDIYEHGESAYN